MIYGYARVSTNGQAKDGNSLEAQIKTLQENGAAKIYQDRFTGTKLHRPQLDKLLNQLNPGDTLIVTKLDRIARSAVQGTQLISELLGRGVKVNVLNMGVMDNSPNGKLIRTIFFAFAEFERDMIVERTSEGKEIAKLSAGFREGRPNKEIPDLPLFVDKVKNGLLSVSEAAKQLGISRTTWYKYVN